MPVYLRQSAMVPVSKVIPTAQDQKDDDFAILGKEREPLVPERDTYCLERTKVASIKRQILKNSKKFFKKKIDLANRAKLSKMKLELTPEQTK